jgi:antitoxin (DNA-binding transcriptional repressor) of toxin-antitoxin stability system
VQQPAAPMASSRLPKAGSPVAMLIPHPRRTERQIARYRGRGSPTDVFLYRETLRPVPKAGSAALEQLVSDAA